MTFISIESVPINFSRPCSVFRRKKTRSGYSSNGWRSAISRRATRSRARSFSSRKRTERRINQESIKVGTAWFRSFCQTRHPRSSTVPSGTASPFPSARARPTLSFQKVICKIIYGVRLPKVFSFRLNKQLHFTLDFRENLLTENLVCRDKDMFQFLFEFLFPKLCLSVLRRN